MAPSTQSHTVTIKILLNDLGDPLRYEIDQVTLAEGKMPESDETAAQPHFDCLQCQSRYFISPTIVKIASQVVEIKEEPELEIFDVENLEEIKSEDFDDRDVVEIELISSTLDNAEFDQNVKETQKERKLRKRGESNTSKKVCTKFNLNRHKKMMAQNKIRNCEVCNWSRKCTKAEYLLHRRREHPTKRNKEIRSEVENFDGIDFPCIFCEPELIFPSFVELEIHLRVTHKRDFVCTSCPKAYNRKSHLNRHLKIFHDIDVYVRSRIEEMDDFNGIDFPCIYCEDQKVFTSFDRLKFHLRSHRRIYACPICPRAYTHRPKLETHFKLIHRKETFSTIKCDEPLKEDIEKDTKGLGRENQKLPTMDFSSKAKNFNGVDYPCIYCEDQKIFKSFDELKLHLRSHRRIYVCTICPKAYTARLHLETHFKLLHDKETLILPKSEEPDKYKSDIIIRLCSDGTRINSDGIKEKDEVSSKNEEISEMNGNRTQIDHLNLKPVVPLVRIDSMMKMIDLHKNKNEFNTSGRDFICDHCNASFRCKGYLVGHMKVHFAQRVVCPECPKTYSCNRYLKDHMKAVHQGEPVKALFNCDICHAPFKRKWNLIYHIANGHLGKRYSCDQCSKSFNSKCSLNQHKKNFHQKTKLEHCGVCNWTQTCTKSEYHSHLRRVHPTFRFRGDGSKKVEHFNGVDYPCIYCEEKTVFTSFEMLKNHLSSVHERHYACTICPYARERQFRLKVHIETSHERSARYECAKCGLSYTLKSNLIKHLRRVHHDKI